MRRRPSAARSKVNGKSRFFSAKRQAGWFEARSVSNGKSSQRHGPAGRLYCVLFRGHSPASLQRPCKGRTMIPYGSLVVYLTPTGKRYIKRLEEGNDWHSNDGVLTAAQVHALHFGSEARTSLDVPIRVLEATLFDRLQGLKRQTQVIYAKDIAYKV